MLILSLSWNRHKTSNKQILNSKYIYIKSEFKLPTKDTHRHSNYVKFALCSTFALFKPIVAKLVQEAEYKIYLMWFRRSAMRKNNKHPNYVINSQKHAIWKTITTSNDNLKIRGWLSNHLISVVNLNYTQYKMFIILKISLVKKGNVY